MKPTLRSIRSLAAVAATAAFAILVASSTAQGALKYVASATKETASGVEGHPNVLCPGGWNAIGGGVRAAGGYASHELTATGPSSKGGDTDDIPDGWYGSTVNLTPLGSGILKARAWAICTKKYVHLLTSGTGDIDPGGLRSASIGNCTSFPLNGHVTSGGAFASGGPSGGVQRISQIYPYPDHAWGVTMLNLGGSPAGMYIEALCARGDFSYPTKLKTIGPQRQARLEVRCPPGTQVTGGGVQGTGDKDELHVSATFPVDLGDADNVPDDAWRVHANHLGTGTKTLTAHAICKA